MADTLTGFYGKGLLFRTELQNCTNRDFERNFLDATHP